MPAGAFFWTFRLRLSLSLGVTNKDGLALWQLVSSHFSSLMMRLSQLEFPLIEGELLLSLRDLFFGRDGLLMLKTGRILPSWKGKGLK